MKKRSQSSVKKAKIAYISYSLALIVLGIVMMLMTESQIEILVRITGAVLLCCGIIKFIDYFINDAYGLAFQFDFALGIFTAITGLLLLICPNEVLTFVNIIIGLFIVVDGTMKLQTAKEAKHFGMEYWWLILLLAILTTLAGILLVINPLSAAIALTVVCGAALVFDGLENLYVAIYTVKLVKRYKQSEIEIDGFYEDKN